MAKTILLGFGKYAPYYFKTETLDKETFLGIGFAKLKTEHKTGDSFTEDEVGEQEVNLVLTKEYAERLSKELAQLAENYDSILKKSLTKKSKITENELAEDSNTDSVICDTNSIAVYCELPKGDINE